MADRAEQDRRNATRGFAPRPLGLHLAAAVATWTSSLGAWRSSNSGSPGSRPAPLRDVLDALAALPPDAVAAALDREIRTRLDRLARGIERYRAHPFTRAPTPAALAWSEGTTRLLDFAPDTARDPILVVPSLVNRSYILDLLPERSFLRALRDAGWRPFLLDWDRPGSDERAFGLDDYVAGRLQRALAAVTDGCARACVVIGYCMGGTLSVPLAQLAPERLCALVLLATPWDFHAERAKEARALARSASAWLPLVEQSGELPVDGLQALFAGLDPLLAVRKFLAFADLDPGTAKARDFVALEDWLNDGVPLAAPVARECLIGWYGDNVTGSGRWRIGGRRVDPRRVARPTLVVVPAQDRIVPPATAIALAQLIPGAARLMPPLGHIGMMSSARATTTLWPQILAWLAHLAPTQPARL
jgi:polyhydroxyalkanoate synthase